MISIVVPTLGRPSLRRLLDELAAQLRPEITEVLVIDDRPTGAAQALVQPGLDLDGRLWVLRGRSAGPAAARNVGWRTAGQPWVAFLDDDVVPPPGWTDRLVRDLRGLGPSVGASQGRIVVPLPRDRRPTDWERCTAGLQDAAWATADMAYRRECLVAMAGFDERFPRAFREDADLALRCRAAGWELTVGDRRVLHPVRPAGPWVSVRTQAGNADDALMRRLHGTDWYSRAAAPVGRIRRHAAVTAAGVLGAVATATGHRRLGAALGAGWLVGTGEFVAARVRPGPRTAREIATMAVTSAVIPPAAVVYRLRGSARWRSAPAWPVPPRAVFFDRDGTLVRDVPYNGDPRRVQPMPGAAEAVRRLRAGGFAVGVVSNQSGVGRGLLTPADVDAVNAAVDRELGPFDTWQVCLHAPEDGCGCRKPAAGLVLRAAADLGVAPWECVVVGDIGSDVGAAVSAGARTVLVPTEVTKAEEVAAAPVVAADLAAAVDAVLAMVGKPAPQEGLRRLEAAVA